MKFNTNEYDIWNTLRTILNKKRATDDKIEANIKKFDSVKR